MFTLPLLATAVHPLYTRNMPCSSSARPGASMDGIVDRAFLNPPPEGKKFKASRNTPSKSPKIHLDPKGLRLRHEVNAREKLTPQSQPQSKQIETSIKIEREAAQHVVSDSETNRWSDTPVRQLTRKEKQALARTNYHKTVYSRLPKGMKGVSFSEAIRQTKPSFPDELNIKDFEGSKKKADHVWKKGEDFTVATPDKSSKLDVEREPRGVRVSNRLLRRHDGNRPYPTLGEKGLNEALKVLKQKEIYREWVDYLEHGGPKEELMQRYGEFSTGYPARLPRDLRGHLKTYRIFNVEDETSPSPTNHTSDKAKVPQTCRKWVKLAPSSGSDSDIEDFHERESDSEVVLHGEEGFEIKQGDSHLPEEQPFTWDPIDTGYLTSESDPIETRGAINDEECVSIQGEEKTPSDGNPGSDNDSRGYDKLEKSTKYSSKSK